MYVDRKLLCISASRSLKQPTVLQGVMGTKKGQVMDHSVSEAVWNESHQGLALILFLTSGVSSDKKQILSEDWRDGPALRELAA